MPVVLELAEVVEEDVAAAEDCCCPAALGAADEAVAAVVPVPVVRGAGGSDTILTRTCGEL